MHDEKWIMKVKDRDDLCRAQKSSFAWRMRLSILCLLAQFMDQTLREKDGDT